MEVILFIAKKVISAFCYPLGLSLFLLFLGMMLWGLRGKSGAAFGVTLSGALLLLVMSLPITAFLLVCRPIN